MKLELQNKLFEMYSYMFRERHLDMSKTCMCWGIDTGDGWYDLINELCMDIAKELDSNPKLKKDFTVRQVKEKYGTLRFYVGGANDKIRDMITKAENKSGITCETCGKPGIIDGAEWLSVRCKECKI